MIKTKLCFSLYANCVLVKGINRSAIYDLHNNEIKLIPNDLYNILSKFNGKKISDVKEYFNYDLHETIDEYFHYLKSLDLIFFTESPLSFPKMSKKWNTGRTITNAILDFDLDTKYNIHRVLYQLENVDCEHLQLRYFKEVTLAEIAEIHNFIDKNEMSFISLEFIIPFSKNLNLKELDSFVYNFSRIKSLTIYNASINKILSNQLNNNTIIFTTEKIISQKNCGNISPEYFAVNIKTYTESLHHNSCLNCKLSIDKKGNIKNCPSMIKDYGNISNTTLEEALKKTDFKKYWNITKDEIEVCKDCEFRYACTDCRAYTEDYTTNYSKPLKCGYNPYTSSWASWSENPLKQNAIEFYKMNELKENND